MIHKKNNNNNNNQGVFLELLVAAKKKDILLKRNQCTDRHTLYPKQKTIFELPIQ